MSTTKTPTLKAYKIGCRDDEYHGQCVVFAETRSKARHLDTRENCDCEFIEIEIRRATSFDYLSPGPVRIEDYMRHGWCWECSGCSEHVYGDDEPVVVNGHVYHDINCVRMDRTRCDDVDLERAHDSMVTHIRALDDWIADNS